MAIIQRPGIGERIRRAFGILQTGEFATISPELVPVVLAEDLTGPSIDEGYPRLAVGTRALAASVGEFSEIYLVNPAGAQSDVLLEEIWARVAGAVQDIQVYTGAVGILADMIGAVATGAINLDLRTNLRPAAYIDARQENNVLGTNILRVNSQQTALYNIFPLQFTIPPGQWVSLSAGSLNQPFEILFFFTERLRTSV